MMNKIKKVYWYFESFIWEFYARYFLNPNMTYSKKHSLPNRLVVSLTSYPPRFSKIHLTIKSLLNQSVRPDHLILWIAFADKKLLPSELHILSTECTWFEIRYCEDYRSYKKIVPALNEFPDYFIVTADDDVYYSRNWLKGLCDSWGGGYNEVIAYRAHKVIFQQDGSLAPYNSWDLYCQSYKASDILFATGIGGVFYPPGSLHHNVVDVAVFQSLCPHADDVWLFWMEILNGSTVKICKNRFNIVTWLDSDKVGLASMNVMQSQNDIQISNLESYYGKVKELF